MLKSLREALALYAVGDEDTGDGQIRDPGAPPFGPTPDEIVAPIEQLVLSLVEAMDAADAQLRSAGFDPTRLSGATGFTKTAAFHDAVDALYISDETRRRFEIIAGQVFARFRALAMDPSVYAYALRHADIETIYRKLHERRDTADVTDLLKEIHTIVNAAIRAHQPGDDQSDALTIDLSRIDFEKLREEFTRKVPHKHIALQNIRDLVDQKLQRLLRQNPSRMDYYARYQEIVAEYNREKDRVTIEETFAKLVLLVESLDAEERRAAREGLTEDELALFDLLSNEKLTTAQRETLKQASKQLLASLQHAINRAPHWTRNSTTQGEIEALIADSLWVTLPRPPFTDTETLALSKRVYTFTLERSLSGDLTAA